MPARRNTKGFLFKKGCIKPPQIETKWNQFSVVQGKTQGKRKTPTANRRNERTNEMIC